MNNKAFTLLEVVVSIFILGLIITLFSNAVINYKKHSDWFEQKTVNGIELANSSKTLYADLSSAKQITINQYTNYSTILFSSNHSLYGLNNPNIAWYVLDNNKTIIRVESQDNFDLPVKKEQKNRLYADEFGSKCEEFKILKSKNTLFIKININGQAMQFAVNSVLEK